MAKLKIRLHPDSEGTKEVDGDEVELALSDGFPPMRFFIVRALGRSGWEVAEYRTGRVASLKRDTLFPPEYATPDEAVKAAIKLMEANKAGLLRHYSKMKTINK